MMRSFLALGLLITLCASASAATVHHSEPRHVIVHPSRGYAVPGWAYAAPRPPVYYDAATTIRPSSAAARRYKEKPPVTTARNIGDADGLLALMLRDAALPHPPHRGRLLRVDAD